MQANVKKIYLIKEFDIVTEIATVLRGYECKDEADKLAMDLQRATAEPIFFYTEEIDCVGVNS